MLTHCRGIYQQGPLLRAIIRTAFQNVRAALCVVACILCYIRRDTACAKPPRLLVRTLVFVFTDQVE